MNRIPETARLYMRRFTTADAFLLRHLNSQPGVLQYIPEPVPVNDNEALKILETIIIPQYANQIGRWAVHIKQNDQFIGWCGLKKIQDDIDLGYRFLPAEWGKGYATEAAKAVLDYGHEERRLQKITAHAHVDNIASQRVLLKIGMQFVGEGTDEGVPVKGYVSFHNMF